MKVFARIRINVLVDTIYTYLPLSNFIFDLNKRIGKIVIEARYKVT